MVAAFLEEDGTAVTRTYYSETPVGFPTGRPTMEIRMWARGRGRGGPGGQSPGTSEGF